MQLNQPMNQWNMGFNPTGNINPYASAGVAQIGNTMGSSAMSGLDNMLGLSSSPFQRMGNSIGGMFEGDGGGMFSGQSMFGGEGSTGWVNPAVQGISSIGQGWLGMQQLGLAKDQFAFQKESYNTNLENQTQLTNQAMMDRQVARNNANSSFAAPDEQWKKQNLLPANK